MEILILIAKWWLATSLAIAAGWGLGVGVRKLEIRRYNMGDASDKKIEPKDDPVRTCPFSCESFHRDKIGSRACLAGHWDERDYHKRPLLWAHTLEPIVPAGCDRTTGDAMLQDIMRKARNRGWR